MLSSQHETVTAFDASVSGVAAGLVDLELPELGFTLDIHNNGDVSLSAHVGSNSAFVGNAVVLSWPSEAGVPTIATTWRRLLDEFVSILEPEHAVVTSREVMKAAGARKPWEAGWLVYDSIGGTVEAMEMPR